MADTVPISDVLCEAMEYLSKLGSNLRIRSENLKEKRLRKGKLRNAHAVQKAANKVLLICELSKKSILNVEVGVKKILTQIDASQSSTIIDGGKTCEVSSSIHSDVEYEYIHYDSQRLRIRNKININHFISVKVLAKAMHSSVYDKHPVYYNCKLYQSRKKESLKMKIDDADFKPVEKENSEDETNNYQTLDITEEESANKKSLANDVPDENLDSSKSQKLNNKEYQSDENSTNDVNVDLEADKTSKKKCLTKEISTKKHNSSNSDKGNESKIEDKSENVVKRKPTAKRSKKFKHIKVMDSSDDDTDEKSSPKIDKDKGENKSDCDKENNKKVVSLDECDKIDSLACKEKLLIEDDDISNKSVENTFIDNFENSENGTNSSNIDIPETIHKHTVQLPENIEHNNKCNTEVKNVNDPELNVELAKQQLINSGSDSSDADNNDENDSTEKASLILSNIENSSTTQNTNRLKLDPNEASNPDLKDSETDGNESKAPENENSMCSTDSKPFIKCVNINKLLREDKLLETKKQESLIEITDSDSDKETKKRSRNTRHREKDQNKVKSKIKRRHVQRPKSNRKSKETNQRDNEEYWKLKRIEVKEFQPKEFVIKITRLPKLTDKYLHTNNLNKITKNGSVVCSLTLINEPQKEIQEQSEINTIEKNLKERLPDKIQSSLDCEKQTHETPIKDNSESVEVVNDSIKSSLLKVSTDEDSGSLTNKRKRKGENISPPSKRKHIMESIHAKKMLLTYSSSSDTDDEQLRNTLKEIRNSLLKGGSDEEESLKDDMVEKTLDFDESDSKVKQRKLSQDSEHSSSREEKTQECDTSTKDTSSQVNESTEEQSNPGVEMGRSKSKPGDSSSLNTDTQDSYDKEIDGLTNLKSLTKKKRRQRSPSTGCTQSTSSKSKNIMPKRFNEDALLKAESSSDAASIADSDVGEEVEIAADDLPELNGDSISHLARDDLLGESDSSEIQDNNEQEIKNEEDDSDENNLKLKRRKANAISSDSEAGASRKKDRDVKISDFEDSEDDSSSEPKKTKRKKKGTDSDASVGSSVDGSKKKRRRIKNVDDSDDGSGSESETEGRNKHGRKNIRKVMGKSQLEEATKKAAREEKERIARIAERQKLYNNLQFDESGKPDEVVLDKVVLDFDPETKEPLIEVDKGLVKKLKPHQANGIKFMWDACFESVKRIKKDKGSGCILAHCMGLGKTLQVVSLTHTLLTHSSLTKVNRVLVVCPLSTVLNWVNEYRIWLKHADNDFEVDVYELSRHKQNSERAWQLQQWFAGGGVCVLGYEMFRNLSADNNKKFKKKMLKSFQESLVDPGPDLVVCDEGHLLKNEKTSLSQAMNRVKTLRRIVLTGTPLQNNLKEYYCMVQFVKPNLLGKYNEYLNRFVNPITNGQYTDSTEHDIKIMKRRSHVLHKMLDGAVQRRDYGVLAPFLPPKHEYVLFITLTEVQIKLYQHYLDNYSRRPTAGKSSGFLFPDFQSLQRIWTHPLVLKFNSERYEIMQQKKREREEEEDSEGSLADFIDDESTPEESTTEESSDSLSDVSDDSRKKSKKKKSSKKNKAKVSTRRGTRANPVEVDEDEVQLVEETNVKSENPTEWWMTLVNDDELDDLRHSHKLVLLFDILKHCEAIGDKLLVFSQSLYSLDLIENFLAKVDEATQEGRVDEKLNGHVGSWSPGVDYFRLDGSTSCENRSIWCKNFNREDNPRARLFLISTRAGGLGINLVAANRVVIFDVSWNPSHDVQSIFRVYRFGQKKPCYVYRFLAMGTMEEKIYERQVTKQAISKRVIDEQQIDRHYAENDLAELYKFEPDPPMPRELPPLPKDRLFAEMLKDHEKQIYKYHEHDSLLENKEEETLTEEERKAAWEDFENEKTRPPPAPFSAYMQNGMFLAQQQQQMAFATLAALLRKEMPTATDSQIQEVLFRNNPSMFGGYDYGFAQKLNEMYKYTQPMINPAMMNQALMNSVMNPGGVGMGLGSSSGLQYEPPWQRQQQQQQQLRLQQLMHHQNQMGAKYYAGGLGSRDPAAMLEQQKRARELMLGERSRPRGRPPATRPDLQLGPADIVNLDSD